MSADPADVDHTSSDDASTLGVSAAGIDPPQPWELVGSRTTPVRELTRPPLWWVLGASGGSGATTLARWWSPAADADGVWPAAPGESPYVVIAARATYSSLVKAHLLLRQYRCGLAPPACRVVGLIVSADRPGRRPPPSIARHLATVAELAGGHWWIDYHEHVTTTALDELPRWSPRDPLPSKRFDPRTTVPPDCARTAADIVGAIAAAEDRTTRPPEETR